MLVRTGEIAWLAAGDVTGGLESYPSPLWVGVSAVCSTRDVGSIPSA